jgi:hypothetical protein
VGQVVKHEGPPVVAIDGRHRQAAAENQQSVSGSPRRPRSALDARTWTCSPHRASVQEGVVVRGRESSHPVADEPLWC